ncbi:hypothetical protein AZI86_01885 [Bdellovibrio bacteriovorus]|uniref:Fido domain-containing protein n=1 Tax=Bdellovibrio bacteriovorus TaxID=959 RepID=A0A150WNG6_BDEBC|nr:Fic family protein [Bdellovibrio bacteriovorus]KYG65847.1 hypothetical protein AZI86_01885 [Bdellovibrio bacteriovorus]
MSTHLITFIIFLMSFSAQAADFSSDQIESLRRSFKTTTQDRIFFHWTKPEVGGRWAQQGYIDQGEVDFYNKPTGDRQAYGPGVYMAESTTSSENFGEYPVVFIIPKGTAIYDEKVEAEVFGRQLSFEEKIQIAQKLPFIRAVTGDWWLTNSHQVLNHVEYAGRYGAHTKEIRALANPRNMQEFIDARPGNVNAQYLESLFHLTYYVDGISLIRALRVAPNDPWSQFEPEHFESFKKLNKEILSEKTSMVAYNWGADQTDKARWVKDQVFSELPGLMKELFQAQNIDFRGHGIRAGGEGQGGTFKVSPQELVVLLENPYLSVHYKAAEDGKSFYVSYDYPDIEKFEKLKPLLSSEFVAVIEKKGLQNILSDGTSRIQWNQKLIRDLLTQLFSSLHQTPIDAASFLAKFISIHPYSDGNGRLARLYTQKILLPTRQTLPPMFISDLDVLVKPDVLRRILADTTNAYGALNKALASEFMTSKIPDYFKLSEFAGLMESLKVFGLSAKDLPGPQQDENIRRRQFNEIFSEKSGATWNMVMDASLLKGLALARQHGLNKYAGAIAEKIEFLMKSLKADASFETTMAELREYKKYLIQDPELSKTLLNLESRLLQTVLKFDASTGEGAAKIQEYLLKVPPSLQRSTLQQVMQSPVLTEQAKRFWQSISIRTEIQSLIKASASGKLKVEVLQHRLRHLEVPTTQKLSLAHINAPGLISIIAKMNLESQDLLLSKLNLDTWPTNTEGKKLLHNIANTLVSSPGKGSTEFRKNISVALLTSMTEAESLTDLPSAEEQKKIFKLALAVDASARYGLLDVYASLTVEAHQSWAQYELLEILKSELTKSSPDSRSARALQYLVWNSDLQIPGTQEQIKILLKSFQPHILAQIQKSMPVRHFKQPLYEAAISIAKEVAKTDAEKLTFKMNLFSLWSAWIPEINKMPNAEAWLRRLWQEAPMHFNLNERTELAFYMLRSLQIHSQGVAKDLRTFALNFVAVQFNAGKTVSELSPFLAKLLKQDAGVWELMNDKMLSQFLKEGTYLQALLENQAFVDNESKLNLLLQEGRRAGMLGIEEKVASKLIASLHGDKHVMQRWKFQILLSLTSNSAGDMYELWQFSENSPSDRKAVSQKFADRVALDLRTPNQRSEFVEVLSNKYFIQVLGEAKLDKSVRAKLLETLTKEKLTVERQFRTVDFKSDFAQVLRGALDADRTLLDDGASARTSESLAYRLRDMVLRGKTLSDTKDMLAEFYLFLRPNEQTHMLNLLITKLGPSGIMSTSDMAGAQTFELIKMLQSLKAGDLSVLPQKKTARGAGAMCRNVFAI